jgi:hypothetical protein
MNGSAVTVDMTVLLAAMAMIPSQGEPIMTLSSVEAAMTHSYLISATVRTSSTIRLYREKTGLSSEPG